MIGNTVAAVVLACVALGLTTFEGVVALDRAQAPPAAPAPQAPQAPQGLSDTILSLDQQFWEAAARHDVEAIGRLIADHYVGITPDGRRWTKPEILEQHRAVRLAGMRRTTEREVIRVHDHAAILTYSARFDLYGRDGTPAGSAHQRMVSCWVQRDGGWFVAFAHVIDAPSPPLTGAQAAEAPPGERPVPALVPVPANAFDVPLLDGTALPADAAPAQTHR